MLVAATGYADAFWRLSAWYLNILVDLPPKPALVKMEKMEKICKNGEISCENAEISC
jgi:hypothetical protein